MLITFSCKAHEDIVMFGDVGKRLLEMMGYAGKSSGMIQVEEIPIIRSKLRDALHYKNSEENNTQKNNDDAPEPEVSLKKRAFPLFEMFDLAEKKKCVVTWESS